MEKFIYSTFNEYPEDFENKADAARLETIGYISKMTPFALYCIKDLVKWAYLWNTEEQVSPDAMTDEDAERYNLAYYAARAKGECVREVLKWKKAVDYNFSTGKRKFKESGGKQHKAEQADKE